MTTQTAYGYVREIACNSPGWWPACTVLLDQPDDPTGPHQSFNIHELETNRELVWVSLLRDAFVHSLKVDVEFDAESRQIVGVRVRLGTLWTKVKKDPITTSGQVRSISVREFDSFLGALRDGEIDYAEVSLSTQEEDVTLLLLLRTHNKEITLAELDMLRAAFDNRSTVHVTYYRSRLWRAGQLIPANVIVSVGASRRVGE